MKGNGTLMWTLCGSSLWVVLQQYVLKTIENIAHKESRWSQRFATTEVVDKLVSILKLSKADSCR